MDPGVQGFLTSASWALSIVASYILGRITAKWACADSAYGMDRSPIVVNGENYFVLTESQWELARPAIYTDKSEPQRSPVVIELDIRTMNPLLSTPYPCDLERSS